MKNLIITLGILILMTMGNVYQQDCDMAVRAVRNLKYTAYEMAEAVQSKINSGEGAEAAQKNAKAIMIFNLNLDDGFMPISKKAFFAGKMTYNIEITKDLVKVKICADKLNFISPFFHNIKLEIYAEKI